MDSKVTVKPAEDEHLYEIHKLAHAIWREYYPGIISSAQIEYMLREGYSLEALRRDITQREMRYDRALVEGTLVGFSSHGPHTDPEALMLHKLYVDSGFRRMGCARKLIEAASERARTNARSCVLLRVNKRNRAAIDAYARLGFSIRGSIVADIGGGFVMDDYWMRLEI